MNNKPRVLVTGAGGFVGGRTIEAIIEEDRWLPLAGVRRWSTAARIGRYSISPIACNLFDMEQLKQACSGVDAVIHCAVGDRKATVDGTRNLLDAALQAGVRRVVHVSTIDVYGRGEGRFNEDHILQPTGRAYGDSKIEAENVCKEFVAKGLDIVIIRPTIVYGPHSNLWTVEFAQKLWAGTWSVPSETSQGTCNLVYIDDLVRALILAVDAKVQSGSTYNISGPETPTWHQYVEALNSAIGLPALSSPELGASKMRAAIMDPIRSVVKKAYMLFQGPVMAVYKRSRIARTLIKGVETRLRNAPSQAEFDLYSLRAEFPIERAVRELAYIPKINMKRGVELSALWVRHVGIVD